LTKIAVFLGPIPGVLMNRYGQRMITVIGGVLAATGLILSAFATNTYYLAATFGIIAGKTINYTFVYCIHQYMY